MERVNGLRGVVLHDRLEPCADPLRLVHLWIRNVSDDPEENGMSVLSGDERLRALRFRREVDRRRFVARHAFVRRVLGEIVDRPPETLEFCAGGCGKPRLAFEDNPCLDGVPRLEFSLAHSEDILGLAVVPGRGVGLDLEVVRPIADPLAIAALKFPRAPLRGLAEVPLAKREFAFYRLWTEMEAVTKMHGRGLDCRHAREPTTDDRGIVESFAFVRGRDEVVGALALGTPESHCALDAEAGVTPCALPWPWAGAPCCRTSGTAWPGVRSWRSTACRSS